MDLIPARLIANSIRGAVEPHVDRVEIAGSIRREKSIVKDVELVILAPDYERLYRVLGDHGRFIKPGVPDIIDWPPKANAKYVRMLLDGDIKLDVFVANEENWGSLLCMRTGSGVGPDGNPFTGFSSGILQRWKKLSGGKMIKGQLVTKDGVFLPTEEESDLFDLVCLEWIPPPLRMSKSIMKHYEKRTST